MFYFIFQQFMLFGILYESILAHILLCWFNVISVLPDISSKIHLVQGDKLLLHRLHSQSKAFLKGERLIYKTFPLFAGYPFCLRRDPPHVTSSG